jgi:hypothetical protein
VASYAFPATLRQNDIAYAGEWNVQKQRIVAGLGAKLRLHFVARHVYLVLGGRGKVHVLVNGKPTTTVPVDAYRLYTLHDAPATQDATMELRFTPGVQAYAFTFG